MSAPADLPFDLDTLPPAVREAFAAMQTKVAGLEAPNERQDYLITELRHALYGKRSEQLVPDVRQMASDLVTFNQHFRQRRVLLQILTFQRDRPHAQ